MDRRTIMTATLLLAALTLLPLASAAPPEKGSVTGRLTGASGNAIPGATVYILNATDMSVVQGPVYTDEQGFYQFTNVTPTTGDQRYLAYSNSSDYGEGYSDAFQVEPCGMV